MSGFGVYPGLTPFWQSIGPKSRQRCLILGVSKQQTRGHQYVCPRSPNCDSLSVLARGTSTPISEHRSMALFFAVVVALACGAVLALLRLPILASACGATAGLLFGGTWASWRA